MSPKAAKILLTGLPGCGKTTAVMTIIANLDSEKVAGFYTQEIRQNNTRKGFSWNRLTRISIINPDKKAQDYNPLKTQWLLRSLRVKRRRLILKNQRCLGLIKNHIINC